MSATSVTEHELRLIGIEAFSAAMASARQQQQGLASGAREVNDSLQNVERSLQSQTGLLGRAQAAWGRYGGFVGQAGGMLGKLTFGAQGLGSLIGALTGGPLGGPLGGLIVSVKSLWDGLNNLIDPVERIDPAVRRSAEGWSYLNKTIREFSAEVDKAKGKAAEAAKAGDDAAKRVAGLAGVDPTQLSLQGRLDIDRQATARAFAIQKVEDAYTRFKDLDTKVADAEAKANGRISSALYYQQRELAALRREYEALQAAIPPDTTRVGTNLDSPRSGGAGGESVYEKSRREADAAARAAEWEARMRAAVEAGNQAREDELRRQRLAPGPLSAEGAAAFRQQQADDQARWDAGVRAQREKEDALEAETRKRLGGLGGTIMDMADTTQVGAGIFNAALGSMTQALGQFAAKSIISGKMSTKAAKEAVAESLAATSAQLFGWGLAMEIAAPFAGFIPGLGWGVAGTMAAGGAALIAGAGTVALLARGLGGSHMLDGPSSKAAAGGGGAAGAMAPAIPASAGGGGAVVNNFYVDNNGAIFGRWAESELQSMVRAGDQRAQYTRGARPIGA